MNKKLIVLAVAGAFAAPFAMADSGNVVIYGKASVSYDNVNGLSKGTDLDTAVTRGTSDRERRSRVSSNNSYLGFKGTEDLGNDLSAIWQLEYAIDFTRQNQNDVASSDTVYKNGGPGVISGRNTFVGLSGKSLGSLTFGLQESPAKTATGSYAVMGDTLADYRTLFTTTAGSQRPQNSAMYTSPDMGGFVGKLMMAAQNETGNGTFGDPHLYAFSGAYNNGPISAALAYENTKQYTGATPGASNSDATQKTTSLGGSYNFGDFKLGLAWQKQKLEAETAGVAYNADRTAWNLSGAYKLGANTIMAQYTKVGNCTSTAATSALTLTVSQGVSSGAAFCNGAAINDASGAKQFSVGVDHAMSKRTSVYALYTEVKNDTNAAYALGAGASGISGVLSEAGGKASGISLGMIHSF
jgi:predicted porin